MVGSALVRRLEREPATSLVLRRRQELDLCRQESVEDFFQRERPDTVLFAAARVGGIHANQTFPANFIYENLAMASNVIHAAFRSRVKRLLFLGSTCIYPRLADQPLQESCLLSGPLEETNEPYAIAKIAGLKMCQYYRKQYGVLFHSAMPTNLFGPGDNYHSDHSHVVPGLLRRFHEAKERGAEQVMMWGTGRPRREFLHVDDLADAVVHLMRLTDPPDWVNVGTGIDISIRELAELIAEVVGYRGQIVQDLEKPDGTPVKRTDTQLLSSTGWRASIALREGLKETYACFQQEQQTNKVREV